MSLLNVRVNFSDSLLVCCSLLTDIFASGTYKSVFWAAVEQSNLLQKCL